MWYIKNISKEILIEPESGKQLNPGEIKAINDEYVFLRFCAAYNGLVQVVSEKEYNLYIGSFGSLSQKNTEESKNEGVDAQPPKRRGGRSKK